MTNIKKKQFYNAITGEDSDGENYGLDASIYKRVDNVDMVFDSRGRYLGLRTCRGKFINGKYTFKEGIKDFKSFVDLSIWADVKCSKVHFLETADGNFAQIEGR